MKRTPLCERFHGEPVPDEHLSQGEDCRANADIVAALRVLYAREPSPPEWHEEVLAEIDARLARGSGSHWPEKRATPETRGPPRH